MGFTVVQNSRHTIVLSVSVNIISCSSEGQPKISGNTSHLADFFTFHYPVTTDLPALVMDILSEKLEAPDKQVHPETAIMRSLTFNNTEKIF